MASIREMETKTGGICYEVGVSRGRGKSKVYRRFYPEAGWSKRTIDRELNKFVRDLEKEVEAGQTVSREERKEKELEAMREAAKVQTLKQYGEKVFMPTKKVTISENTRSSFQGCLDRRIYPALGDLRLPDITSANISAFLLSVQAEGKSHGTVIKYYTILKSLFKMAYMNDEIPRNPMDKVERPKPRKDEARKVDVEAYTEEETAYILECLEKEPLKWRVLMELMIDTGIRRGECCGLKWSNVDFQSNTITIEHNLCYTPEKGVYLDTPKNGKVRNINVAPEVMALLKQLRTNEGVIKFSPYVFTQDGTTEPMHPQSPTRYMQKFSARYGIQELHPHKLRHSFASIAITNGADIASVSEILGHSDKAVTLRMYTHADQASMTRASNIFREAIKRKQA